MRVTAIKLIYRARHEVKIFTDTRDQIDKQVQELQINLR